MRNLLHLLCAASLTACVATPKLPDVALQCPQPMAPPAHLMKPLPRAGIYSDNARQNMLKWQRLPTGSATTLPSGKSMAN